MVMVGSDTQMVEVKLAAQMVAEESDAQMVVVELVAVVKLLPYQCI